MSDLRTPGLFDPETVECALTDAQVLGRQLPVSSFQVLCLAAEAWLADSSPDYEAALNVLIAEDIHEASGLTMTGVRKAVDAAFPRLDRE